MIQDYDIVVVGAGMVGAALAAGLGHSGFSVALVDRGSAPGFQPDSAPGIRVSALSTGSERYLTRIGAWAPIQAMRATPYARLAVWDGTPHPLARLLPNTVARTVFAARDLGSTHLGHIVENNVTQQALWQVASALPSVRVYANNGVAALDCAEVGATVTLEDHRRLRGQLVIGADGAQSQIRTLAGISVSRDQYSQQALVACVRYRGPVEDITWQAFFPSGPRAFLPLYAAGAAHGGETWASLVWYDAPEVLARLKALPAEEFLAEVQRAFPNDLAPLTHVDSRASFPIARQHAHQYAADRVVLVGDAAHTINPLAGQGVNLGFQDAACLHGLLDEARRTGADLAAPALLHRYERVRRPANRRMMLAMDAFYHLFSNRRVPLHLARNLGLGLAQALPYAKNRVARYAIGLDG
ncbi:UbiH/UbiF/VisC/COQ6 family ubiquinone biosynthesis hydroxylase [Marinobacter sp. X15-166B]|uniref:UbiH/UbiF/VisC/COQ6 family ubiquinone biosynthesis hydroxylase n=1 Tax=Marinobacter sp. X15-166B TaxID=1897620 RepID=UPI00085CBC07|nr:UbiH/UbiF/VisC/COQ6 family ubiquinone biosynthesis hydroxylase [Marinobacter sp. X15-166B]OEY65780.1 ubiquinone biosynthesis protein UbiH [Marinobacter sp. X15-166B]